MRVGVAYRSLFVLLCVMVMALPVVGQDVYDWGDAPDTVGVPGYATLAANNGANHMIAGGFYLGSSVDAESDGQPDASATGDDNDGNDDEDGVAFITALVPGQAATVSVTASVAGKLDAWIDFNRNGNWLDPGEQIAISIPLVAGVNNVNFNVPAAASTGQSFARFRFSSGGGLQPDGGAPDGEVEDYAVTIGEDAVYDWGDAPDTAQTPGYPTLAVNNGAYHAISGGIYFGSGVDAESDGQPDTTATGDDNDGNDDEDGVNFTSPLSPGALATVTVVASVSGMLDAWIDYNGNTSWNDAGEQIFSSQALTSGSNNLSFTVPAQASTGTTFARFRISTAGGLAPTGGAVDGEVEDYIWTFSPTAVTLSDLKAALPGPGLPVVLLSAGGDTVYRAAGYRFDGLVSVIRRRDPDILEPYQCLSLWQAAYKNSDKLITIDGKPDKLYKLDNDPAEQQNLIAASNDVDDISSRMSDFLKLQSEYAHAVNLAGSYSPEEEAEIREHLRALGYMD